MPRHCKQYIADTDGSSPEPQHSGHIRVSSIVIGRTPLPIHAVHVSVLTAPVPLQWAHRLYGEEVVTIPLPPQTQHVERYDIMPKGSFPLPLQNAQVMLTSFLSWEIPGIRFFLKKIFLITDNIVIMYAYSAPLFSS